MELLGRATESRALTRLLDDARAGEGRSIVLRGEAGIGKTALLDQLAGSADDCTVVRVLGVEFESEFALAALADLVRQLREHLTELPRHYASALAEIMVPGATAPAADRHTGYAATLALLTAAAVRRPLLCLVDDAHWLDRASAEALLFTARRLLADAVLIVFAARDVPGFEAPGVPDLTLTGLDEPASLALLARAGPMSPLVAARLAALTLGNPLALIELPRVLAAEQPDSVGGLVEPLPTTQRLERAFAAEVGSFTPDERQALLVCAAAGAGAVDVLAMALTAAGLDLGALDAATRLGLVRTTAGAVTFRHPLVRSAVYAQATPGERRRAHLALAQARTAPEDADRRAWHLAHAAVGQDDALAEALEATAERARLRGGVVAQAAALERAAALTTDLERRGVRLCAAAAAWMRTGAIEHADTLIEQATALGVGSPSVRIAVLVQRGYQAMLRGEAAAVFDELVSEADRAGPAHRLTTGRVLSLAMNAPLARWDVRGTLDVCERAMQLTSPDGPDERFPKAAVRLALARVLAGQPDGAELAARTVPMCERREAHGACSELAEVLLWLDDLDSARRLVERDVAGARAVGDISLLAYALPRRGLIQVRLGRPLTGYADALEGVQLAETIGQRTSTAHALCTLATVEAVLGRDEDCAEHAAAALALSSLPDVEVRARHAVGVAALAAGRAEAAVVELARADELLRAGGVVEPGVVPVLPDLVEALVRLDRLEEARPAVERLAAMAARAGRPAPHAAALRCQALIATASPAAASPAASPEALFTEALDRYATVDAPLELARTQLCFGQWLRRQRRRRDAERQLATALATFDTAGAQSWAGQARSELAALGTRRPADPGRTGGHQLTPQEWRVAWAAAQGLSSRDIATEVFLSVRTVDYHLGNVYRKLGVRSRRELIRLVGTESR